jgi:hypothetical protein
VENPCSSESATGMGPQRSFPFRSSSASAGRDSASSVSSVPERPRFQSQSEATWPDASQVTPRQPVQIAVALVHVDSVGGSPRLDFQASRASASDGGVVALARTTARNRGRRRCTGAGSGVGIGSG